MSTKHQRYLDSLRGLECMVVVWVHFVFFMYPGIYQGTYSGETINYHKFLDMHFFVLLLNGNTAVSMFFILSGFVLSYRFMGAAGMKWQIAESIIKRPIRLAGVILFTMLPVLNFLLTKEFWASRLWVDYDVYAKMFLGVFTGIFSSNAYLINPPLWTINTELWGSFLIFGLCFLIGNFNKNFRLGLMLAGMVYFSQSYYFAFIFGMMLADFHKNWHNEWFIKNKNIISWIILSTAILFGRYITDLTSVKNVHGISDAVSLFLFVLCNDKIKRILEFRPLVFIGGISYSIYVLHWLILQPRTQGIHAFVVDMFGANVYSSFAISLVIGVLLVIVAAWLLDKLVDKPCIKFSSWFAKKLVIEIQSRTDTSKIIKYCSRYIKTLLKNIKEKFHSSSTNVVNVTTDIKPSSSDAS